MLESMCAVARPYRMQKKRPRTLVIALALAGLAVGAQAIGISSRSTSAILGQPLDHVVSLRLDPGESLTPECVAAEVISGDLRLHPNAVSTRLEGDGSALLIRVLTSVVIEEPVVTIALAVGCPPRVSRRFVLFVDPAPTSTPSAPIAPPVESLLPPAAEAQPAQRTAAAEAQTAAAAAPAAAPAAQTAAPAPRRPRTVSRRSTRPAEPARPPVAARPRLKLDAAEPPAAVAAITAEIIEAASSAAAARAAAQATAAAAERITSLERSIERLRADSAADRDALRGLRQRAIDADKASTWMLVLAALVAVLAALAAWLWLKLRRLQVEREQTWWNATAAADGARAVATEVPTEVNSIRPGGAGPTSAAAVTTRPGVLGPIFKPDPALGPVTEPPLATEHTQPLPVGWREDPEPSRDVSIDELIDLEQQAEFFIVLGQEDAAVDLLVDHLRSTGGGSPIPYLKLLEIYRRRGDRDAYERTRARFNHRFNAYAPDWESEGHEGRWLEDYPNIVARLQMAWPSPIDAMAELESLLFRKTRGDLFEMPAYRDVLFLYSLARDLLDREPMGSDNVDVLLPITEGNEFTQPMSLDAGSAPPDSGLVDLDSQPTVPVDLDITRPAIPESLFGEPNDSGIGNRRRR